MGIKMLNAKSFSTKLKATIQATGKLGFTDLTAEALNLSEDKYIAFGQDEDDKEKLFLVITEPGEQAFKVCKSGDYYYLPTTRMFLSLDFDYKNYSICFDLVRDTSLDASLRGDVYKMNCRKTPKKQKKEDKMK